MAGRTKVAGLVVAALLALPAGAWADAPAPAFTDYAAPAADQYGSPTGGTSADQPAATPTPAPGPQGGAAGQEDEGAGGTADAAAGDEGGNAGEQAGGTPTRPERSAVKSEDVGGSGPGGALPLREATGDGLPFTGFDLAVVALLGVVLLAAGAALRLVVRTRAAARRTPA